MAKNANKQNLLDDDTPMMQQYQSIKKEFPDAILFFRMGDFYEMFNEDAKDASKLLDIALTSRNKNKPNAIPMCGVPHHSANMYISRLVKSGKTIAICEQMEDPKQTKGLVRREVVRVITPGTVLDDNLLDPKSHHFLVSLYFGKEQTGLAALDMSTGLFKVTELPPSAENLLQDELAKLDPKEILIPENTANGNGAGPPALSGTGYFIQPVEDWMFHHSQAHRILVEQFKTKTLDGFGCEAWPAAVSAAGALVQYLKETQKSALQHITSLSTFSTQDSMMLDQSTINSLELVQSSDGQRKHSLLGHLDATCTPLGARRLREWILKPLIRLEAIEQRLDLVGHYREHLLERNDLRERLKHIFDLERLLGKISMATCTPRDLIALKNSLRALPEIQEMIGRCPLPAMSAIRDGWDNLDNLYQGIDEQIEDDPPLNIKDGGLIKPGCDQELDRLKSIMKDSNQAIANLEAREKERTGIPQLKVGYNKIYGYYLEVTKKNLDRVPDDYIRKQSLVNAERFISPELKQYESEITGAEEKVQIIEQRLFHEVRQSVAAEGARIQAMAKRIGELDALLGFAQIAHQQNYCRPQMDDGDALRIQNGRHPLVELIDPNQPFIPNDTHLDCDEHQVAIITGPNMAGKSTYLRQVALIVLMAQIGCFVPAEEAEIGLVDRIFSRVGAQDHLQKGQSTFMVEMNETANILNNATRRSLIVLDEIGRGTSTFDGISIAWAIVEFLQGPGHIGAKTLFATHYHELTELERLFHSVKNYNVQIKEWNDQIIFLRKIVPGGADKSYGIHVARLAGLPEQVLQRANEVLFNLENSEYDEVGTPKLAQPQPPETGPQQLGLFGEVPPPLIQMIKRLDLDDLTPRQALEKLYELRDLLKKS
ncbi:DNA mismatch repair protein mutS [Nitrospina gracilis 3/211]|uniref:DNA mismatch repair protein MutS n=1 Tax=Nitrospina gracilis (strain 3/211) TaxID=1266370 RepID=M1YN88_NITG3|nr:MULTISPECIES: DNA mismatch repair protein MutS [Nitrospina]MCF8724702.1 DNA mismatch repair protein MutS [Nitrospina sp. Nb-3]CCQ91973.1 DNA mismatch repair protein mutS [Nitrospina gracilis 3/211]